MNYIMSAGWTVQRTRWKTSIWVDLAHDPQNCMCLRALRSTQGSAPLKITSGDQRESTTPAPKFLPSHVVPHKLSNIQYWVEGGKASPLRDRDSKGKAVHL